MSVVARKHRIGKSANLCVSYSFARHVIWTIVALDELLEFPHTGRSLISRNGKPLFLFLNDANDGGLALRDLGVGPAHRLLNHGH
jgi:hypothetical protein